MLRSLFSGISGLRQHQTMMDVTGNNIANVNTTGYKSSAVTFQDTLSQTMQAAGAPAGGLGGTNPIQVGLGVKLNSVSTNFGQGSAQTTGVSTNMMVQGDGFFMVNNGSEDLFTRAGAFSFDTDGRLTNGDGMVVQGWMGKNGVVDTNAPTTGVQIPTGTIIPPVASRNVKVEGNLGVTNQVGDQVTFTAKLYDEQGQAHNVVALATMTASDTYSVQLQEDGNNIGTAGSVKFDSTGAIQSSTNPTVQFGTSPTVTWDITGLRQYGGSKSAAITSTDGSQAATLEGFQVSPDGTVTGIFSNGVKQSLAQVALANFNNPNGLEKVGGTNFRSTINSGLAQVGTANSGGRGGLLSNSLEMSNVDLGQEFTNLIIAQRGFQANSKVITSSDEMLEQLVNMKR